MNARPRLADPIRAALAAQWPRPDCETVVIDLPLPISTNDLHASSYATVRRSERYRTWALAAGVEKANDLYDRHRERLGEPVNILIAG